MTQEFYPAISVACLQLHHYVIPFLPIQSQLSQLYGQKMQSRIDVKEGQRQTWSSCIHVLEGHTEACYCIAFSPDGRQLVSGSGDHTIQLWNIQTGALLQVMSGHNDAVLSLAYSPNGMFIASGSPDTTVRIWAATTGLQVAMYAGHATPVWCVAFSADGACIASGSTDGKVHVWSMNGTLGSEKVFATPEDVIYLAYTNPNKLMVISVGGSTAIW